MRMYQPTPRGDESEHLDAFLDVVVQRLFATGMGIEAIVGQLPDGELADRLAQHVSDLDETTEEIRRAIGPRDAD